ncbi:ATP-binding protein [Sphingomonas sp. IC081]|uniref:ATP-binding protein n=1 Tax=Sphingomonas sp. IC081 TaxID=304378 RepID=UPI00115AA0A1|nr:ATP-binding protein [Sphingomonas sp. IC081]QDK35487.1 two-component sensor histidine kinase [Sphingomonas sp. IC081]
MPIFRKGNRSASLSARIAGILVAGLLLAQLLTSTIWFESRRRQMLEIPARVFATRVADALRLLEARPPGDRAELMAALQAPGLSLRFAPHLPAPQAGVQDVQRSSALLQHTMRVHLGRPVEVRVISAQLLDDRGRPANTWAMLSAQEPAAQFRVAVRCDPDDPWLLAEGHEDENGADLDRVGTIADYVVRIYALRILIVGLLTWFAVRLSMTPLKRMADAAEALGRDIHSPPLETSGPREVRRAAEAFNAMQQKVVGHIEERTRFLAAVSHDLRSPITRLRLRTEMLPDEAQKAGFRKDLVEMEEMVDATLSFMKGGADEELTGDIDLDVMLGEMVANLRDHGAAVTLSGSANGRIAGFPNGLRRCIGNLVENALRYAGSAQIVVSASPAYIAITVQDRGPGIPEEALDLVFEPFYRQEDSRNVASGGVGLGLSIARDIAAAHQGTLWLRNRSGGGLEANLRLPRGGCRT